jgi:hypothetical protein
MHGNHSKFISLEQRQSAEFGDELYRERAIDRFGRLIHVRHDRGVGPQQRHGAVGDDLGHAMLVDGAKKTGGRAHRAPHSGLLGKAK